MIEALLERTSSDFRNSFKSFEIVTAVAIDCQCSEISGIHLLIALLDGKEGVTREVFEQLGLDPDKLVEELRRQFMGDGAGIPKGFNEACVDETLWTQLLKASEQEEVTEHDLIAAALLSLDKKVAERLLYWLERDDIATLAKEIRLGGVNKPSMHPFDDGGDIDRTAFRPNAWRCLELTHREAMALGLKRISIDVLALAILESDGLLTLGIRSQAIDPVTIQENLLINLRNPRSKEKLNYAFEIGTCYPSFVNVLNNAALLATRDGFKGIDESHVVRALLSIKSGLLSAILLEVKVDTERLMKFVKSSLGWEESEEEVEESTLPSIANTELELKSTIVGQDSVIARIMPLIKRLRYGHKRIGKPGGLFLFMGKSGTGKTMMAKALAKAVFGSPDRLIMLEMGQFKTDESINTFIGAPPGYKGFGQGKLTNGLRDNPESVILFDEVEKASEQVYDALLRFLDEGLISDPAGPVRDGSSCLIVLTSNIAAEELGALADRIREHPDNELLSGELRDAALSYFKRPELINRIDELILFNSLGRDEYGAILEKELDHEIEWFSKEKKIKVELDDESKEVLTDRAFERNAEGARAVGKILTTDLIAPLIDYIVGKDLNGPLRINVSASNEDEISFTNKAV